MSGINTGSKTRDWIFNAMAGILGTVIYLGVVDVRAKLDKVLSQSDVSTTHIIYLDQRVDRLEKKVFSFEIPERNKDTAPVDSNNFKGTDLLVFRRPDEQYAQVKYIPRRESY